MSRLSFTVMSIIKSDEDAENPMHEQPGDDTCQEREEGDNYEYSGDPRRCRVHPHVKTSSDDGMFDGPCGECEAEMEMYDAEEERRVDSLNHTAALRREPNVGDDVDPSDWTAQEWDEWEAGIPREDSDDILF